MTPRDPDRHPAPEGDRPRRSKAEVLAAQRGRLGCCERNGDGTTCDCLAEAYDEPNDPGQNPEGG